MLKLLLIKSININSIRNYFSPTKVIQHQPIHFDYVIIGGGAVGLSVAHILSTHLTSNETLLLLEKNSSLGEETSSRNSQVIHSGIYYPVNSLKSLLCLKGKNYLLSYLKRNNVDYKTTGKLIIATNKDELQVLNELSDLAKNINLQASLLDKRQINILEPNVDALYALHIPSTAIFDSIDYMSSLEFKILEKTNNSTIMKRTKVENIGYNYDKDMLEVNINQNINKNNDFVQVQCSTVINSAGLHAHSIYNKFLENLKDTSIVQSQDCYEVNYLKGHYFKYFNNKVLFNRLIYPVPDRKLKTLGIHSTIDLDSSMVKFGPDAVFVNNIDYRFNENLRHKFLSSAQKYCKVKLDKEKLIPDYSGIRPRVIIENSRNNEFVDFVIKNELNNKKTHCKLINLIGIESPGLTCSLAIGEYVASLLDLT